jgi:hypothetical protein
MQRETDTGNAASNNIVPYSDSEDEDEMTVVDSNGVDRSDSGVLVYNGFRRIGSAHRNYVGTYAMDIDKHPIEDLHEFLRSVRGILRRICIHVLAQPLVGPHKLQLHVQAKFRHSVEAERTALGFFTTYFHVIRNVSDLDKEVDNMYEHIISQCDNYLQNGSGRVFEQVLLCHVNAVRHNRPRLVRQDAAVHSQETCRCQRTEQRRQMLHAGHSIGTASGWYP